MTDLRADFDATVHLIKTSESRSKPSNDLRLEMYALFKQATEGDVSGKKPGRMDFVGGAKYNA